jgi:small subunit ribosomal protein S12
MPTFNQLLFNKRVSSNNKKRTILLQNSPQKKGFCIRVYKAAPKKPNSAQRSVARIGLTNTFHLTAYIPGETHNLQKFSAVLVRGGRLQDVPGVNYKVIRGKYDCQSVLKRKKSRSLYGTKKWLNKSYAKVNTSK